jgi:hypothetical protein
MYVETITNVIRKRYAEHLALLGGTAEAADPT